MTAVFGRRSPGPMSLLLAGMVAACSGQTAGTSTTMLGFGAPGVDSYAAGNQATTLNAQVDQCGQVPPSRNSDGTDTLAVACDQLRRTQNNQPGNVMR